MSIDMDLMICYNIDMSNILTPFKDLLSPSLEVSIDINDPRFEAPVAAAGEYLAKRGKQHFYDAANGAVRDEKTGMLYVVANPSAEVPADQTEFLVMPAPFANAPWPHMVARAEILSDFAARAGYTDAGGQPLSIMITGSPGMVSRYGLTPRELRDVRQGDIWPVAQRHLGLASRLGYGMVRGFYAASQSSTFAPTFMDAASQLFDVDGNLVINEPSNATKTNRLSLGLRFLREGARFGKAVKGEGLPLLKEIIHSPNFEKGIIAAREENLALTDNFVRGDLQAGLERASRAGIRTTAIHGDKSLIARSSDIALAVNKANNIITDEIMANHRFLPLSRRIEVLGGNHSLPDRLGRSSALAALALTSCD